MDATFTHILHGDALKLMEYGYTTQIEQIRSKVNEIEKSNEQTTETINDLVTSISLFMNTNSCEYEHDSQANEKIGDIENAIECIQSEIGRIKTSSFADGEKMIKMNRQMHVLSSKYVDFNTKINHHLLDFNRINTNKINADEIIDNDAKPFMVVRSDAGPEVGSRTVNKYNSCRFVQPFIKSDFTRVIRVEIKGTNIKDLNLFKSDFATEFEQCIGKNMVKRMTITKYRLQDETAKYISCVVEFKVPLNYEYINNHKFPVNWDFLPIYKQQHASRAMTSRASQYT